MKVPQNFPIFLFGVACLARIAGAEPLVLDDAAALNELAKSNVVWNELGKSSRDSMPLGNGDMAANVWVEENGDICFYLAKSDAWSELVSRSEGLLKLGRVRVAFSPNPFVTGAFRQSLDLRQGAIEIVGGTEGLQTRVKFWIDANANVLRIESVSDKPVACRVQLEPMRTPEEQARKDETLRSALHADDIVKGRKDSIVWFYRNTREVPERLKEGPGSFHPESLDRLTSGGMIRGKGFHNSEDTILNAAPGLEHDLQVAGLVRQTDTPEDWVSAIDLQVVADAQVDTAKAWKKHVAWWESFWTRSWIFISGGPDAEKVTQAYALQRFMAACSSRGRYPAKFNGSLFTMDLQRKEQGRLFWVNGDFRRWGGRYWFQNTRLIYWPMLAAGDFDLMLPFFRMYREILETNAPRVRELYGFDASMFPETTYHFGGVDRITKESKGHLTRHYWLGNLEYTYMALEYYRYTGSEEFARETLVPAATWILRFYANYFGRDALGRLNLDPLNSGETWVKVKNPAPDTAALHQILDGLLALPAGLASDALRKEWSELRQDLPPVPLGERDGERVILAAEDFKGAAKSNFENPELYTVFPFAMYGIGKPDIEIAKNTFSRRLHQGPLGGGWNQDPVVEAMLGDAKLARNAVVFMSGRKDPSCRFPAMWMDHQDYVPNFCHGGVLESTLQSMLMQSAGRKIVLLPAWPRGWSVQFRLHAPKQTVVTATAEDGRVVASRISPEARAADLIFPGIP